MTYDDLLKEADQEGLIVKEKPLRANDGRIKNKKIAIRRDLTTTAEKACVLAEELGHHYTSTGSILDQSDVLSRRQELLARLWGYERLIGMAGLIKCFEAGCRSRYEAAELLGVTEEYLMDALAAYKQRYGLCRQYGEYMICFEPLMIIKQIT